MEDTLVVGRPNLVDKKGFLKDVEDILDTRNFTNVGPYAKQLERCAAEYLGVKHAITVCNCTIGLQMVLGTLPKKPAAEVIVPAYTFIATAHAVTMSGLTPVFCDVDASSHLVDLDSAERCVGPNTVAIIGVHLWGLACDADAMDSFAERHGLQVFYDAAHAFGAQYADTSFVGTRGSAEVFSLHATKLLNSFEGGIITTDSDELARKLLLARNFGIAGQDMYAAAGTNAKLSEIHSALALRHLNRVESTKAHYRRIAKAYVREIADAEIPAMQSWNAIYIDTAGCTHAYILCQITGDFSRDMMMEALRTKGIMGKRYFYPGMHHCKPYIDEPSRHTRCFMPVTDKLNHELLTLPTGTTVDEADVHRVVSTMAHFLRFANQVHFDTTGLLEHDKSANKIKLAAIERKKKELQEELAHLLELENTIKSDTEADLTLVAIRTHAEAPIHSTRRQTD